jgi:peptide/nickel transport system permease protein
MNGSLFAVIAKRLLAMVGILLVLAGIVFILQQLNPSDPVHAYLGANSSAKTIAAERHKLGFDRSIPVQYVHYVWNLLHGNLERSLRTRRPVVTDLHTYLPATLELTLFAIGLTILLATLLGVAGAARWRGAGVFKVVLVSAASTPTFLIALLGLLFFYHQLHWLPATGRTSFDNAPKGPTGLLTIDGLLHGRPSVTFDALWHLILPGLCVALIPAISVGRVLRSSIVNALRSDHVRTARAKGLPERRVLWRHTLRNSASAALSMGGLQVGLMFAGVVVVEQIFAWPGIGFYTVQSIPRSDFPAIAGVTLVLGAAYVLINLAVDIAQTVADPRITL